MNIILLLFLVFIVAPISNLIHELGHLTGAKLAKADAIRVHIGRGRKVFQVAINQIEIVIGIVFISAGVTESRRDRTYKSYEVIYITLLGPLFNAIAVFICYLLYEVVRNEFLLLIMLYNGWLFMMNCIPFKMKDQASDGYIVLKEIFGK
ncbi:site-2 protease family protein [Ornithinibacillus contaminans]|uniref:site-2 protease family protein n=1 Tax=Ornithinibacillus contaminans TaxID=694055 RepID=UPI00064D74EC|nr:site-2 protease family protein [Ornithinibacillus contaminans]